MRLRSRLLILFALFAVVPLLAIGVRGYFGSLRSLEALVSAETSQQAERIARVLRDRLDHMQSDVALLSDNEETQQLLRALAAGDTVAASGRVPQAERFVDELWASMQYGYERIAIVDLVGHTVLSRSDSQWRDGQAVRAGLAPSVHFITDAIAQGRLGELQLQPRGSALLPDRELQEGFGERRHNVLLERDSVLRLLAAGGVTKLAPPMDSRVRDAIAHDSSGVVVYQDSAGERRIGAFVNIADPPWTVLATASVSEFAAPFLRQRVIDLGLLLLVVLSVTIGFSVLLRRTTRPLDQLATAAASVGEGDLAPELPAAGDDEVGRLTRAFADMATRLRAMLAQVEASRQTAVLGRFAVELAHEIRNPLTSVKLNLQALARDGRDGRLPPESRAAVEVSLREVSRIDQALRTALRVGRPSDPARQYDVREVIDEAVSLLSAEAAERGAHVAHEWHATSSGARGDPDAMRGVFVNLLVNAIQAVGTHGTGGRVFIEARDSRLRDDAPGVEIRVRDEGPGIAPELRDRIFHPFFTTREQGTGLGLSVALQTVQSLGGSLRLSEEDGRGAEFVVTLPLATEALPQ